MIGTPEDIMIHDDEVPGNRITFVKHVFVDTFHIVYRDGQRRDREVSNEAEEEEHDKSINLHPPDPIPALLRHLSIPRFPDSNNPRPFKKAILYNSNPFLRFPRKYFNKKIVTVGKNTILTKKFKRKEIRKSKIGNST